MRAAHGGGPALEACSEFTTSEGNACACDLSTAHVGASLTNGQALPDPSIDATQINGAFATATAALVEWGKAQEEALR